MKRFVLALIAASSLTLAAHAANRPRYGGTLRVATTAAPMTLDPGQLTNSPDGRNLARLLFDTLVELDERGTAQPALAASWEAEPGGQRWQFRLRSGVRLDDGTPLTAELVAATLRSANSEWRVSPAGDSIVIELASAVPNLPAELALVRNSIVQRGAGKFHGTGPFSVAQCDPGKRLVLTAREDYWRGRPFVNSIEIDLGKSTRDQRTAFDLGKLDLADVPAEQSRQAATEGVKVATSQPVELLALAFARAPQSTEDSRLRQALALSIDRTALNNVLLRDGGEVAASLLPNWLTGYSFVFSSGPDPDRARLLRTGLHQAAPWTLSYDTGDPIARLLVDRITLNARDAGISLQPVTTGSADVRLARVALNSLDDSTALRQLASGLGLPTPKDDGRSPEELYAKEKQLLQTDSVIPLLHLRIGYALGPGVRNWAAYPDGSWQLSDVWLGPEKP